jgi:predicted small secreted protein
MKRAVFLKRRLIVFLAAAFFLAGCNSLMEKSGKVIDGAAFKEKETGVFRFQGKNKQDRVELAQLRSKDGMELIAISLSGWPSLELRGTAPGTAGYFEFTSAEILSSHLLGWNEFSMGLLGNAVFRAEEQGGVLHISSAPKGIQISGGRIRLKSGRLSGNEALTALRNRHERILALTDWMHQKSNVPLFKNQKQFEQYWKPILFPELVSKKKRPGEYSEKDAEWVKSDSIKWNKSYTESAFSEDLWEIRNQAALLRDWEEAAAWIYIEYSWDSIFSSLDGITLQKLK